MGQPRRIKKKLFCILFGIVCIIYIKYLYSILTTYKVADDGLDWKTPYERKMKFFIDQHGDFFVFHNVKRGVRWFFRNESITLVTHGTYQDLYHLPDLVLRWHGPISIALYTNGHDLNETIWGITHLLHCSKTNLLLHELVTFHMCMHHQHMPADLSRLENLINYSSKSVYDCSVMPAANPKGAYWYQQNLTYPLNLLRNIGRFHASTYYVMSLNLGWYPIVDIVPQFLRMMKTKQLEKPHASIFCFPRVIVTNQSAHIPFTQKELYKELNKHLAEFGHDKVNRRYAIIEKMNGRLRVDMIDDDFAGCKTENLMVNSKQPYFDERLFSDTRLFNLFHHINYDFVHLGGTALIRKPFEMFYVKPNELRRSKKKKPSKDEINILRRVTYSWLALYGQSMSINTAHTTNGVLFYAMEYLMLYIDCVTLEFVDEKLFPFHGVKHGRIYITSHRMIFINNREINMLQSMSFPYIAMSSTILKQSKLLDTNIIEGNLKPQRGSQKLEKLMFKIRLPEGGEEVLVDFLNFCIKSARENLKDQDLDNLPVYKRIVDWFEPSPFSFEPPDLIRAILPKHPAFTEPQPNTIYGSSMQAPFVGIKDPYYIEVKLRKCRMWPMCCCAPTKTIQKQRDFSVQVRNQVEFRLAGGINSLRNLGNEINTCDPVAEFPNIKAGQAEQFLKGHEALRSELKKKKKQRTSM